MLKGLITPELDETYRMLATELAHCFFEWYRSLLFYVIPKIVSRVRFRNLATVEMKVPTTSDEALSLEAVEMLPQPAATLHELTNDVAHAFALLKDLVTQIDEVLDLNRQLQMELSEAAHTYQQMFSQFDSNVKASKGKLTKYLEHSTDIKEWIAENLLDRRKLKKLRESAIDDLIKLLHKLSGEEFRSMLAHLMELRARKKKNRKRMAVATAGIFLSPEERLEELRNQLTQVRPRISRRNSI